MKVTGTEVVIRMVDVDAGKTTVVVLVSRVEIDSIVVVCPSAVVVTVSVNDDAGNTLIIVDAGISERDVLTVAMVVVISDWDSELGGSISSPDSSSVSSRTAEKAELSESIWPLTSEKKTHSPEV